MCPKRLNICPGVKMHINILLNTNVIHLKMEDSKQQHAKVKTMVGIKKCSPFLFTSHLVPWAAKEIISSLSSNLPKLGLTSILEYLPSPSPPPPTHPRSYHKSKCLLLPASPRIANLRALYKQSSGNARTSRCTTHCCAQLQ